jgi:tetratricopeptide (TPR) repeat protein
VLPAKAAAGVLALVCVVAYWNSFDAGLLLDNKTIILKDPRLTALSWQSVRDIFTHHYWWPSLESHLYRPLTTLSYWLNYSVLRNGPDPSGYHAVNLLLHWLNATLVFALVRAVSGRPWAALAAAAVFACHPLTVESVTNVVGRADLLAAMSVVGGILLYRRALASSGWPRRAWLTALGGVYLAGVFCKESAVVLPAVMLLHDLAFPAAGASSRLDTMRRTFARAWPACLAIAPGVAALLWARWVLFRDSPLFGQFASDNPIVIAPFWTGLMTAVKVAGYCLALMVWPARLSCDYSYNAVTLFGWTLTAGQDPHAWAALAVIIALIAGATGAWRRDRAAWFLLGFAAVAYLPTSNLLMAIGTIMAERLTYLPLAAMTAAVVLGIDAVGRRVLPAVEVRHARGLRVAGATAALLIIGSLTARSVVRNEDWTSDLRLWSSSEAAAPESIKVHRALAAIAMDSDPSGGRADEAIDIASRGLRVLEQAPLPLPHMPAALFEELGVYYSARARVLAGRGETSEARAALGDAVRVFEQAAQIDREINRLGKERLLRRGPSARAVVDTGTPSIYRNLGWAYLESGDAVRAVDTLDYLRRIRPGDAESHYVLGVAMGGASERDRERGDVQAANVRLAQAAVSLIEASLLNPAHEASWETLERVYGLLAPGSAAVLRLDGRRALNMSVPLVAGHFREACVGLVRQLAEAGMREDAERWRHRMTSEFGVPAGLFRLD